MFVDISVPVEIFEPNKLGIVDELETFWLLQYIPPDIPTPPYITKEPELLLVELVVFKIDVTPPIIALLDIDIPPKDNIDPPKLKSVASAVDRIDKPPLKRTDPIVV